jgi:DNA-binding response OmpR family regulator
MCDAPMRIVVVDDDRACCELITVVLQDAGYTVEAFSNSVDGFRRLTSNPPDLLVLDYAMPVMSGRDILQVLQEHHLTQLPVIILSASTHAVNALSEGAYCWMEKPFMPRDLVSKVSYYLDESAHDQHMDETIAH